MITSLMNGRNTINRNCRIVDQRHERKAGQTSAGEAWGRKDLQADVTAAIIGIDHCVFFAIKPIHCDAKTVAGQHLQGKRVSARGEQGKEANMQTLFEYLECSTSTMPLYNAQIDPPCSTQSLEWDKQSGAGPTAVPRAPYRSCSAPHELYL